MKPRIVIAGTGSGTGKTTISIGLMQAFKDQGFSVQGFKCGPDYIDPSYHTAVTGRPSRNLDSWMLHNETLLDVYQRGSVGADISIIEGVMGMYDGKSPESNRGSTAEISTLLQAPILLVVNIGAMARSAAAIVKGFQLLSPDVHIGGVIVNQAGSEGHYRLCKTAIEMECGIPVVGYLLRGAVPAIPERHLGLIPAIERGELHNFFAELGATVRETVDLEKIRDIGNQAIDLPNRLHQQEQSKVKKANIAVAYDAAFNFYYPENLELLEKHGAKLLYFSPLKGEALPPESHGLYIGGGFPEEFAEKLAAQADVKVSIRKAIAEDIPVYAECGGFMYLMDKLVTTDGNSYDMLGIIAGQAEMKTKLAALGYREVTARQDTVLLKKGESARGHEFRYSDAVLEGVDHAYDVKALRQSGPCGYNREGRITASYIHLHFGSNPDMAARFVKAAADWKVEQEREQ